MAGLPPARESRALSVPCVGAVKQWGPSDPRAASGTGVPWGTEHPKGGRWQWLELGQGREGEELKELLQETGRERVGKGFSLALPLVSHLLQQ